MSNKYMDPEVVITLAGNVKQQGEIVKEQFDSLVRIVASVRDVWNDNALDEFLAQFSTMNTTTFSKIDNVVNSCAQYMVNEANRRLETEEQGVQEARKLSEYV